MNSIAEVMSSNMAGANPATLSSYSRPMTPREYRQPAPAPIVTRPHHNTPRHTPSTPSFHNPRQPRPKTPVSARPCRPPTPELSIPQDCPFPVFPGFERPRTPGASPPGTPRSRKARTPSRPGTAGTIARNVAEIVPPVPMLPLQQEAVKPKPRPGFFRRLFSSKKDVKARSNEDTIKAPALLPSATISSRDLRPEAPLRSATAGAELRSQNVVPMAPSTTDDIPLPSVPMRRQLRSTASTPNLRGNPLNRQVRPSPLSDQAVRSLPIPSKSLRRPPMPTFNTEPPVPLKSPLRAESIRTERRQSLPDIGPTQSNDNSNEPTSPKTPVQDFAVSNVKLERAPQLLLAIAALKASVTNSHASTNSGDLDLRPDTPASHYSGASSTEPPDGSVSTAHTSPEASPQPARDSPDAPSRPALTAPKSMADIAASLRSFRPLSLDSEAAAPSPSPTKVKTGLLPAPSLISRASSSSNPSCRGCGSEISGRSVKAADDSLTGRYHKECFTCHTCSTPLDEVCYIMHDRPYCAYHYHDLNHSLCHTCGLGIEGAYVETDAERKHHVDCFVCETCGRRLTDCHFEVQGRCYCETDGARAWAELSESKEEREEVLERRKTRVLCT